MKAGSLLFALGLVVSTQIAHPSESSTWLADDKGCKLWDPNPKPGETVAWTGPCVGGFAEGSGVRQWIVNGKPGSRYEGPLAAGKANGRGTTYFPNGLKIEADYVDDKTVGPVVMYFNDGARYEGDFVASKRTGKGVLTYASGDRYEGDFVDGKWSGKGTYTSSDGARYEGDWVESKRTGKGFQLFNDGSSYSGEWRDDKPLNPEAIKRKSYSLNSDMTGSHLLASNTTNIQLPAEKSYAQLTPEQRRIVKSAYDKMPDADEPPYPLNGLLPILRASEKLQHKLLIRGELSMAATIDARGNAISVEVFKSPDREMAKAMASVLLLEKYKPALCAGSPCQMQFPFRTMYHVDL